MNIKARRGRVAGVVFAAVAIALGVGSVAWACTVAVGQTYFWDSVNGHYTTKTILYGDTITFQAHDAVVSRNGSPTVYAGVTGLNDDLTHNLGHACMESLVRETHDTSPDSSGHIHNHDAQITRSPRTWQACYYEVTSGFVGATATGAAVLTVL